MLLFLKNKLDKKSHVFTEQNLRLMLYRVQQILRAIIFNYFAKAMIQ